MPELRALSIRQPWAWAIFHAGKTIENRDWASCFYRGPLLLHAGKSCTRAEYSSACAAIQVMRADLGLAPIEVPPLDELARGCLVGIARIVAVARHPDAGVARVAGRDGVLREIGWSRACSRSAAPSCPACIGRRGTPSPRGEERMQPETCPSCSRPAARVTEAALLWCVGVTTSLAFHHEDGRVCVPPGRWCSRGEEARDAA